jgi:hypothetical protein
MTQLYERTTRPTRPAPDEVVLSRPRPRSDGAAVLLRVLGALTILVVGAVHLEQYFAAHFDAVPVIGPLFALNFAAATLTGLGLLLPFARLQPVHLLLSLEGVALAATSFVFLFVSEHRPLFGFEEYGYRPAILIALAAEAAAVLFLGAYLGTLLRRR